MIKNMQYVHILFLKKSLKTANVWPEQAFIIIFFGPLNSSFL